MEKPQTRLFKKGKRAVGWLVSVAAVHLFAAAWIISHYFICLIISMFPTRSFLSGVAISYYFL